MFSPNKKRREDIIMKKLEKKDKILLGVLIALIVIVIAVGVFLIVKNTSSANEQTANINSSAALGEINSSSQTSSSKTTLKSTPGNNSSDNGADDGSDNGSVSSKSSASSKAQDSGANASSSAAKKKSSSKSSKAKVKGDKVKRVVPKENTSHATNKKLSINGKTCYVGDTITVVMNITSDKSIVNYQGTMSFSDTYLKVKDVKSNDFGIANSSGNSIMYNASTLNGMNFSETGTVFTATFEVLKSGSTKLENNLEIISELIDNNIKQLAPSDYKATVDIYS